VDASGDALPESGSASIIVARSSTGSEEFETMTTTNLASIPRPFDAIAARLSLIDEAEETLDLQYYKWGQDDVGYLLLQHLITAADRGVAVRLLVDDLSVRRRSDAAASLCLHPNIDVRLFNPWRKRSNIAQGVEFLGNFSELDRRMHNKLLVADGRRSIVGGRNIADAHFGLHDVYNLVDHDILFDGPGAKRLSDVFHGYWHSTPAVPATKVDPSVTASDLDDTLAAVSDQLQQRKPTLPPDLLTDSTWRDSLAARTLQIDDDCLQITFDIPGPTSATRPTQVIRALHQAVSAAQHELVIVTPFFVPNEFDVTQYWHMADRGVRIRLLTNSLASNSGTVSNSGLDQQRKAVVQAGVELYELRDDAADKPDWQTAPNDSGYLGLHAKLYTIDGERLFFGSVNLDPRSKFINTEIGMLVKDGRLADETAKGIEQLMAPRNSWRVGLDADDRLTWTDDAETTHRQPARNLGQRVANTLYDLLPIKPYI
jgi:putative cardiolipin synthase